MDDGGFVKNTNRKETRRCGFLVRPVKVSQIPSAGQQSPSRFNLIQRPVHRQLPQHDHLRNTQQGFAVWAF